MGVDSPSPLNFPFFLVKFVTEKFNGRADKKLKTRLIIDAGLCVVVMCNLRSKN